MPSRGVSPDVEMLRAIRWIGSILIVLLLILDVLILISIVGSAGIQSSTTEMMALTRDMNESTTTTMVRLNGLISGVKTEDVTTIVESTKAVTVDINSIVGPIASSGNVSALVAGVQAVTSAIDAHAVASMIANAAAILHEANGGIQQLNITRIAQHFVDIVDILDPVVMRTILNDILNVTAETRTIVDALATSHNLQVTF